MKKHQLLAILAAFFAVLITGCTTSRVNYNGGSRGKAKKTMSAGTRVTGYETVTKTKIVPPADPVRIEPYPNTWDAEAAIDWAKRNSIHGPLYKPCHSKPGGTMCLSNEKWMTESEIRVFYAKQGKGSVFCGATWVIGQEQEVPYTEQVPITEQVESEDEGEYAEGGGGDVNVEQHTSWHFSPKLEINARLAQGGSFSSSSRYAGGSRFRTGGRPPVIREQDCDDGRGHYRPRPQMREPRACPRCHVPHSGPCRHVEARPPQQRGKTIIRKHYTEENRRTIIRNAPPGYRPKSSSSRTSSFGTTRDGGYKPGNPGLTYYNRSKSRRR